MCCDFFVDTWDGIAKHRSLFILNRSIDVHEYSGVKYAVEQRGKSKILGKEKSQRIRVGSGNTDLAVCERTQ